MNRSEYEELIEKGYTEEEIKVSLDDVSRMEISDSPLGPGREDRGVTVRDAEGIEKKTSSIMMGYNKQGIVLENGQYVSWEEVELAINETLSNNKENTVCICKKNGKRIEPAAIVEDILERSIEKTYLTRETSDKISNQQAAEVSIHEGEKEYPKGIEMLGNNGIQLPDGKYVSRQEIELALQDYIILTGPEPVITPPVEPVISPIEPVISPVQPVIPPMEPIQPTDEVIPQKEEPKEEIKPSRKNEVFKVIKRIYHEMSWVPLAVGIIAEVIAGFGKEDVISKQEIMRKATALGYDTSVVESIDTKIETAEETVERLFGDVEVGGKVYVPEGVEYYSSSDHKYGGTNRRGVIGEGSRQAGEYNVDGFSILKDGRIHEVEWNKGEDLVSVLQEISKETNTPIEDLIPMVHIGGPVAGWLDVYDLFNEKEKEPQVTDRTVILDETNTYEGVIEDFTGDTITINNGKEDVTLKVKKDDGSFVQDGDIIIGSDGQQYEMTDIEVNEMDVIDVEEVVTGSKINWSIKNITLEETLAIAGLTAAAMYVSKKIPRKEMVEMTEAQINSLIAQEEKEFIDVKGEYEGISAFNKATQTLVGKQFTPPMTASESLRNELIRQNITVENINDMSNNVTGGKAK